MTIPDKGRIRDLYEHVAPILAVVTLLVAFSAVGWSWQNTRASNAQQQENAVTNCENANESREAARTLWGYVVDLSEANNTDATPEEAAYLDEFRAWINKVYAQRDCSDLSKKYPLPPPPSIPAQS